MLKFSFILYPLPDLKFIVVRSFPRPRHAFLIGFANQHQQYHLSTQPWLPPPPPLHNPPLHGWLRAVLLIDCISLSKGRSHLIFLCKSLDFSIKSLLEEKIRWGLLSEGRAQHCWLGCIERDGRTENANRIATCKWSGLTSSRPGQAQPSLPTLFSREKLRLTFNQSISSPSPLYL